MPSKTAEHVPKLDSDLQPHQDKLLQLGELAGIYMDHKVFRILIEFLNMGIDPDTVYNLLKTIKRSRNTKSRSSIVSQKSN
ncbi:hypothetical protein NQ315_006458 [Exocentrus adspersus]|uniref:Mitotic-spindle organizing protein 1 n=1 Tax=Exocentrus adspersus TaxID=1586481 RepID=A0AAV8W038_9CUCU|nr:hypothetical protein NQ315_006458 [Exocentrus adspersus]